ncbi:Wzz/FepE/Etk N-terminal domain-containing protein [Opacimonas viscosa]|uniref:Wzz/FepE/Etk N-terminal domain-containing protein n=1 Tax=Opacimonas viscosa TaxID=2961944 RepID=A0AA41WYZ2_9ALTE|nr:Wzz/FepE/Etk N-terminal domain-containing protein [Opacimonas viscosa]MCP3429109.1 Wzz/FepE/Etk N-terminal domain-containing protein [Opacimonas viscosa]
MNTQTPTNQAPKPAPEHNHYADDEIDLKELFTALWAGKKIIIGTTFIASVLAVVFALSMPNIYRSEALLAPVGADGGGMSGLASKFGGLASLAGVSLPGGGGDKTTMGIEVLKSRAFFAEFVNKYPVMVDLMAAKGWNSGSNTVLINSDVYDVDNKEWLREVDAPRTPEPSVQEAHEVFKGLLSVSQDKESSFVTISVEHFSPYVAKQWVDWLVQEINNTIREQDVAQAQRSIDYLKEQIQATQLADLQAGFFELIQSQTETIMLANASPEYLFKTLDPAVIPELKAKPKRALICVLGAMLGGMLGVLVVLIRHFTANENS